ALAEAERHHGGADAGPDVDGPLREPPAVTLAIARPVEAMDVAMAGDAADGQLVEPRQRHLSAVGVPREDQRDPVAPGAGRLLRDGRRAEGGEVLAQPAPRLVATGVAGVRVVQPAHLEALVTERDDRVAVAQDLDARPLQRQPDLVGARPVVVIAEHAD